MDYIHHYDDESSISHEDDNEKSNDNESKTVVSHRKRQRKYEVNETTSTTTISTAKLHVINNNKIKLLSSPNEIKLYPSHDFVRNVPHIRGNWAGNIYITLGRNNNAESYHHFKKFACHAIKTFYYQLIRSMSERQSSEEIVIVPHFDMKDFDNNKESSSNDDNDDGHDSSSSESNNHNDNEDEDGADNLHISLAKPFFLQQQSIKPFYNELKQRINMIERFPIVFYSNSSKESASSFSSLEILVNENQTRSFLTIPFGRNVYSTTGNSINHDDDKLKSLIAIIDSVLVKYGLDSYYEKPKFHCSIASWKGSYCNHVWMNNDNNPCCDTSTDTIKKRFDNCDKTQSIFSFQIQGIHCDFGTTNKNYIEFANC